MGILTSENILGNLPSAQLEAQLTTFLGPLTKILPEKRLREVAQLSVQSLLAAKCPIVARMAASVDRTSAGVRATQVRLHRFIHNKRVGSPLLYKGLYQLGVEMVAQHPPSRIVVAIDPVNFEKPYVKKVEGVSHVHKATPPALNGQARTAVGYPAITACIVNTPLPAVTYANWFSYTLDFISQNKELEQAVTSTRQLYPSVKRRFVADSGLDDQKIFEWFRANTDEFVIRASHLERKVEVYNSRTQQWEAARVGELAENVVWKSQLAVRFSHAGVSRDATIALGWEQIRLPGTQQSLGLSVAEEVQGKEAGRRLVLLTNVSQLSLEVAKSLYEDWRLRGRIEQGYRFYQEAGLEVEKLQVRDIEAMRVMFGLVLVAAQFVYSLLAQSSNPLVAWLRELGGASGYQHERRNGPYILLQGLAALYQTLTTLSLACYKPFITAAPQSS